MTKKQPEKKQQEFTLLPPLTRHRIHLLQTGIIIVLGLGCTFLKKPELGIVAAVWLFIIVSELVLSKLGKVSEKCVVCFEEKEIKKKIGKLTWRISYDEAVRGLKENGLRITKEAYVISMKRGRLSFPYYSMDNEGLSKVISAYRYFAEIAKEEVPELPNMTVKYSGRLGRVTFYAKNRRNSWLLGAASFAFLLFALASAKIGGGLAGGFVLSAVVIAMQYSAAYNMFQGIYHGRKREQEIRKWLEPYENVKRRGVMPSYRQLFLFLAVQAGVDFLLILWSWTW